MPELPEVETVKNGLLKYIKNKKILKCSILYNGIIAYPDSDIFIKNIENQTINDISRRGKYLIFELDNYYLLSHLRMEGKYFIKDMEEVLDKHDHVLFKLDDNKELRYNDTRKFGKMFLYSKDKINDSPLKDLGLEPWSNELNIDYLKEKLNKKKPIKTLLLDQSIIAGIGNIYDDEILFLSKIHPETNGCSLTLKNIQDIIDNTRNVLEKAISLGGTTIHTFKSVNGIIGKNQDELLVHGKDLQPCPVCGSKIKKIVVNTRGTYYCEKCQVK